MSRIITRRGFLQAAGGAAVCATLLARLNGVRARVDEAAGQAAGTPFERLAGAYSLGDNVLYLNHGSTGTIPRAVQQAHWRYLELCETNPWLYLWGGAWDQGREDVRKAAAAAMGCGAGEVALTHNTTETFNLLAQGLPLAVGDEVLFSSLNHPGASICWQLQAPRRGYRVRRFAFPLADVPGMSEDDVVAAYAEQVRERTRVLVLPHLDNMIGLLHPLARLARMARERGVEYVLVDGAQTLGMLPLDVSASGVDVFAVSPHKWVQAPKGLGASFIHRRLHGKLQPMWVTWGQQDWAGSVRIYEDYGTRNFPELMALGDALHFQAALGAERKLDRYRQLRRQAMAMVDAAPGLRWRSPRSEALSGSLYAIGLEHGRAGAIAGSLFRDHGIVLRPFDEPELNSLRISPNLANTGTELTRFIEILERARNVY